MQAFASSVAAQAILVTPAIVLLLVGLGAFALYPGFRAKIRQTAATMGLYDRRSKPVIPLPALIQGGDFEKLVDDAIESAAIKNRTASVLYGRIDHLNQVGQIWGEAARKEAISEVARIIRTGTRETDFIETETQDGNDAPSDGSFIIHVDGANEQEAGVIAQRLLKTLEATPMPSMGYGVRLGASFGVAQRRQGEASSLLYARAHAALNRAQSQRKEMVTTPSEWQEVHLLPAPVRANETPNEDAQSTVKTHAA